MKSVDPPQLPVSGAKPWPLSVEAYHVLGEAGVIPKDTELLYGFVFHKVAKSPLHCALAQILQEQIQKQLPMGMLLRVEKPITCSGSEAEPDLAVVSGTISDFRSAHPRTAELIIEVCVTSLDYDRSKLRAYASAGVKECWLVLGPEKQIEMHSKPVGERFTQRSVHGPGGEIRSKAIPNIVVNLPTIFAS